MELPPVEPMSSTLFRRARLLPRVSLDPTLMTVSPVEVLAATRFTHTPPAAFCGTTSYFDGLRKDFCDNSESVTKIAEVVQNGVRIRHADGISFIRETALPEALRQGFQYEDFPGPPPEKQFPWQFSKQSAQGGTAREIGKSVARCNVPWQHRQPCGVHGAG